MNNTNNIVRIEELTLIGTLPGVDIPVYIFRDFKKEKNNPIEKQIIKCLTDKGIVSCHIPRKEHAIWTDICRILFCQAFLYREGTHWIIDNWQIQNRDKIKKRWERLSSTNIHEYFKFQWRFLERLQFGYMDSHKKNKIKKEYLIKKLWRQSRLGKYADMDFVNSVKPFLDFVNSEKSLADNTGVMKQTHLILKKEILENDYLLFNDIEWQPAKHLNFYLELMQCIDNQSILNLMKDILDDFNQSPQFYEANINNLELNPWRWGMPDIVVYDKSNCSYIVLECKGPTDRIKKQQIRWFKRNADFYRLKVGIVVVSEKQIEKLKVDFDCSQVLNSSATGGCDGG